MSGLTIVTKRLSGGGIIELHRYQGKILKGDKRNHYTMNCYASDDNSLLISLHITDETIETLVALREELNRD